LQLNKSLGREGESEPQTLAELTSTLCGNDITPTKARMIRFAFLVSRCYIHYKDVLTKGWQRYYAKELDVKLEDRQADGTVVWRPNPKFWDALDHRLAKQNALLLSKDKDKADEGNK
jgi:hypothetical protein